jgi:uncharacterized protein (TIGR02246 family)
MLRRLVLFCYAGILIAQNGAVPSGRILNEPILKMMMDSQDAWNRGDLVAFASYYEDSPDTTFMGREVVRGGTKAILERYRKSYPTREAMGTLAFSEIMVRPLAPGLALVTGKFSLTRTVAGGGDASGRYTLVVRQIAGAWKIIHDHTSS